jgi:hypothetical protein
MPYRTGKIVKWNVKVTGLRQLLTDDDSKENAVKVGKEFYKTLTSSIYKRYFKEFDRIEEFNEVSDLEEFNDILESFWDYCDENLIWVDFK